MWTNELGILALCVLLFVAATVVFAFLWRRSQMRLSRAMKDANAERLAITRHYDHLTRYANDAILLFSADLKVIDANEKALTLYGYSLEEFKCRTLIDLRTCSDQGSIAATIQWVNEVGSSRYETTHVSAKGHVFPVEATLRVMETDSGRLYQNIIRDISERKNAEAALLRLNAVYSLLALVNQALIHVPDEESAFKRICLLAVKEGGYSAAAVFLTGEDHVARIVAFEGLSRETAASVAFDLSAKALLNPVISRAIREGESQVSNRLESDPRAEVVDQFGARTRFQSLAACPIRRSGKVIGALAFAASTADFFGKEELHRLDVLAADISNALDVFVARRNLLEAQERLREQFVAIEQSPVSVVVTDTAGNIRYVNPKFVDVTGYSSEEVLGKNPRVLKSGETLSTEYEAMWRTISAGQVWRGEFHNRRKNGELYWESATIAPVRNTDGKIVQFVAVKEDITELKAQRDAAREAERQFRSLFEDAPIAYHEVDTEGIVRRVNRAECDLLGVEASDLVGQPIWKSVSPDQQTLSRESIRRKISGEQPLEVFTREFVLKDGSVRTLEIHDRLVRDSTGVVTGIRSALLDVSQRVEAEAAVHQAAQRTEEADRSKGRFLRLMSHELRTPISGILGYTHILLNTDPPTEQMLDVIAIRDCATCLLDMVQQILDLTEAETGSLHLQEGGFSVRAVLNDVLQIHMWRAEAKQLRMKAHVEDAVPSRLYGDSLRLGEVLTCLLDNALKFTERGEIGVTVALELPPDHSVCLHFTVSDTGIGIPESIRARIFDSFTQADMSDTRPYGGIGLGLTMTAQLVNLMGGRIWVESKPGDGSTFHFTARFLAHSVGTV